MKAALFLCIFALALTSADARVLLRVEGRGSGRNLLADPGLEQVKPGWKSFGRGFLADTAVRHSGKASICCTRSSADADSGAFQTIVLNQKSARAIRATAWSRAQGTGQPLRGDYSLYLDIQYEDGAWVWGRQFNFGAGTHGWEQGEVLFQPEKPIKIVNVYLLFRKCVGTVWFDGCTFEEIAASNGQVLCDNVVVRAVHARREKPVARMRTLDGLHLDLGALESSTSGLGGVFFLRDVAAGSDFVGLDKAAVKTIRPLRDGSGELLVSGAALGMKLDSRVIARSDHIRFDCEVRDTTGRNRAVTIGFAVPMPEGKWNWWHSVRRSDPIAADRIYCDGAPIEAGAVAQISKYPFACIGNGKESLCLAIPMSEPCVYRIGCNGSLRWYTVSFDLGLCPKEGVTRQKFSLLVYRCGDGMRAAAEKYYRIFPGYFVKRVKHEGNWMAFTKVSTVRDWQDFAFAFHEGDNDLAWDAQHGVYSFRYTEPMSYWMSMPPEVPRTAEHVLDIIDTTLRQTADASKRDWASATKLCLAEDESGKPRVFILDAPWCNGAMFLENPNPAIPTTRTLPASRAGISWSARIADQLYGDRTKPQLAGEYLDSSEMGGEYVNCRREHFRYAVRPLSFTAGTRRPCILQQLSTYEFAVHMADDVHRRGKLMMANGSLASYGFMGHLLDVLGTETNWLADGRFSPLDNDVMDMRRTLCGRKPFCFLMNTDYQKFDHAMVEKYFQRCMFWGMFPGFFSQNAATNCYFDDPKLYDRDRDLFKKYLPVIQDIARAGWQPITMARVSSTQFEVERFGPGKDGRLFFAVRSSCESEYSALLKPDPKLGRFKSAAKLPAGQPLGISASGEVRVTLSPDEVAVIELSP